ncbi:MAG: cytochrome b [Burkholderiales bacterium]
MKNKQWYTRTAMILHWLLALGVLTQFCLGWWMRSLPDKTGVQAYWFNLHKSIGLTVFVLAVVMLIWRIKHPPPTLPDFMPAWQRWSAKACHHGLYVCILIMPISGYMGSSFTRFPIRYFGVALPNFWGWESPELKALCSLIHLCTVWVFMSLVALHIGAALMHLFISRDRVFQRMWRWRAPSD